MKITSRKNGSSRERVEVECDCVPVANWRIEWATNGDGMAHVNGRSLRLSSGWGAERDYELALTESEAIAVAKAVLDDLLSAAANRKPEPAS